MTPVFSPTPTLTPAGAVEGFFTLAPCRVVDTRDAAGPYGGPPLAGGGTRVFTMVGRCGIPSGALAISLNVTVVQPTAGGFLTLYPGGASLPLASTLNYRADQIRANNAIVRLGPGGTLAVYSGPGRGQRPPPHRRQRLLPLEVDKLTRAEIASPVTAREAVLRAGARLAPGHGLAESETSSGRST